MNRVKELRTEAGMKQMELAKALSTTQQTISKYESEVLKLDPETIYVLCRIFRCTSDYLLGLSTQRTAQISDADAALVSAYHAAPESVREGIDALLRPYGEENKKTAAG